jgi:c-di-GMP-binding flagellar brake protein YcgR
LRIALDIVAPSVGMERRRSPRTEIELECTLTRDKGGPIAATTVDLGPGGMCVRCDRPLAEDELIAFAIPEQRCDGRARVLREQTYKVYALRFEEIAETQREALAAMTSD